MRRYLFLTLLAVLAVTAGCAARDARGPEPSGGPGGPGGQAGPVSAERRVADMRARLGLRDEQAAAVMPIIEEQFRRREAIMDQARSGGSGARKKMQAKLDDLEWDIDKKLAAVLTGDQMLAYSRWVDEQTAQKSDGDRPEPPGGAPSGRPGPPRR